MRINSEYIDSAFVEAAANGSPSAQPLAFIEVSVKIKVIIKVDVYAVSIVSSANSKPSQGKLGGAGGSGNEECLINRTN
jgi:hypothetical protein